MTTANDAVVHVMVSTVGHGGVVGSSVGDDVLGAVVVVVVSDGVVVVVVLLVALNDALLVVALDDGFSDLSGDLGVGDVASVEGLDGGDVAAVGELVAGVLAAEELDVVAAHADGLLEHEPGDVLGQRRSGHRALVTVEVLAGGEVLAELLGQDDVSGLVGALVDDGGAVDGGGGESGSEHVLGVQVGSDGVQHDRDGVGRGLAALAVEVHNQLGVEDGAVELVAGVGAELHHVGVELGVSALAARDAEAAEVSGEADGLVLGDSGVELVVQVELEVLGAGSSAGRGDVDEGVGGAVFAEAPAVEAVEVVETLGRERGVGGLVRKDRAAQHEQCDETEAGVRSAG